MRLPGQWTGLVEVAAGRAVGPYGGQRDDDFSALLDGLVAAMAVQVRGRVAGIGGVDPELWQRLPGPRRPSYDWRASEVGMSQDHSQPRVTACVQEWQNAELAMNVG